MKRALTIAASALAVGAGLLAAPGSGVAAPASTAPAATSKVAAYTPPPLKWGTCSSKRLQDAGAQCALMVVPLDYARPRGTKIKIAVSRVLHTDPDFKGMIAVNPGGPGGSGLNYSVLGGSIPNGVGAKYDWYGFDPRGVGSSQPSLSCNPNYPGAGYNRPNYVPNRAADRNWWLKVTAKYARDCGRSDARALLRHIKTTDVARDLDSLRRAAGHQKLNYYGFSYGTYLGQVYATLFPQQVGRFVWDGVLNAKNAFYRANVDQNVAFDQNINRYFGYLAQNNATFGLGRTASLVRQGYYRQLRLLDRKPAAGGRLGPDELTDVLQSAAYYVYSWVEIGQAYAKLVKTGDGRDVLAQYPAPGDDNGFAVYNAVQCTDAVWPNLKRTFADTRRTYAKHPFLAWSNTWYNAPCLNWPAPARKAVTVSGKAVKTPILMIAETYDAATVYSGALATRQAFPTSYLIEGVGGTTHSGSLSGIACTDNTIASYLDTGELPARAAGNRSDQQCAPVPAPQPTAAAALRAREGASSAVVRDRMPADLRAGLRQAQLIGR